MRELHAHVTESAEPDNGYRLAGAGAPAVPRRVRGDSRTQQRGGLVQGDAGGDTDDEVLVDDDMSGVSTLGGGAVPLHISMSTSCGPTSRRSTVV